MITTTIEWFDANATRPGTSGEYWCIVGGNPYILSYSRLHNYFNVCDYFDKETVDRVKLEPTHWAHIPEQFKEAK